MGRAEWFFEPHPGAGQLQGFRRMRKEISLERQTTQTGGGAKCLTGRPSGDRLRRRLAFNVNHHGNHLYQTGAQVAALLGTCNFPASGRCVVVGLCLDEDERLPAFVW